MFTSSPPFFIFFFFNDTATTEIYTLSLHDALPLGAEYLHLPEPQRWGAEHHQRPRARVEACAPAHGSSLQDDVPDPAHLRDARAPDQRADRVGLEAARPYERRDRDPALREVHPEPHAAGRIGAHQGHAGARLGIARPGDALGATRSRLPFGGG